MASQPVEVIEVDSTIVGCDGGSGPLGHPRVFLTMDSSGRVTCPYCGRLFVRKAGAKVAGH